MSKFLSWFKDLSSLKKTAVIIGAILFITLLPVWLWITAIIAFFAGIAISLAALTNQNARKRITRFKLPGIRQDKKPFALAVIVFIYFMAVSVVFGAVAGSTTNLWFGTQEKPTKVVEETKEVREKAAVKETKEKEAEEPESEELAKEKPAENVFLVTRVIDGDTIEVSLNGKIEQVRLIGIDAPEKGQAYCDEATDKTVKLCLGKKVRLEKDVSERDRYGRLLRYVFVGELFVNAELVKQGFANVYTYPPDVKYNDLFLKLQQEARENNRGLWAQAEPEPSSQPQPKGQFVGSRKSDKYHYPSCYWAKKINLENEVWFSSAEDAQAKGYIPCKVCRPPGPTIAGEQVASPQPAPTPQVQEQPAPEPAPTEVTVHITRTGEKYHRAGCRYLSKSDIPISLSEAKARGYTPCSVCSPPQ